MNDLELCFVGVENPQLERTLFFHTGLSRQYLACRGKTPGAFYNAGTFQWSPAVRALAKLLVLTALSARQSDSFNMPPRLSGERKSEAASLDYAIGKQPNWLLDMFGLSSKGEPLAKRLIFRTNPERRRPGPVSVCVNPNFLPPARIKIFLNEKEITSTTELEHLAFSI